MQEMYWLITNRNECSLQSKITVTSVRIIRSPLAKDRLPDVPNYLFMRRSPAAVVALIDPFDFKILQL
jgi:hypothetical protein